MATHLDDEEQAEQLKQWWKENWLALAGGLVIGLAAIFGWEGWKSYSNTQNATASRLYEQLKIAVDTQRGDDVQRLGDALISQYASSPYASGAALVLAATAVDADDLAQAQQRLQWAREHGYDEGVRMVARLREAQVLWQQGQLDAALKLLDTKPGHFAAQIEELRGDIQLAQGDHGAARVAYQKALAASVEDPAVRTVLQQKIDDLAEAVQS